MNEDDRGLTGLLPDICGAHAASSMPHAILHHDQTQGILLERKLDEAIYCTVSLTSLITTAALFEHDKKISLTRYGLSG